MATLRNVRCVEVMPGDGWIDRHWDEDPDVDALGRSSRRVCERYGEVAAEARLGATALEIVVRGHTEDGTARLEFHDGPAVSSEVAIAAVPRGLVEWSPGRRARLALELVHRTALALAQVRGTDPAPFQLAHQTLLAEGLDPVWHGRWISSPSGRHKARAVQRIADDGFARVWLEVCVPGGEDEPLGRTPSIISRGNLIAFGRIVRQPRWHGADAVTMSSTDWLGNEVDSLTTELVGLQPVLAAEEPGEAPPAPCRIELHSRSSVELALPPKVIVNRSFNGRPQLAPRELRLAWRRFADLAHLLTDWWAGSGWAELAITVTLDVPPGRSSTTRSGTRSLDVHIHRGLFQLRDSSPAEVALSMAQESIRLAARRTGLPVIPLPERIVEAIRS